MNLKVLHYIPGFNTGGIEAVFLNWYKNLDDSDVTFELLVRSYDPQSPMLNEYLALGGKLHSLDMPSLSPKTLVTFRKKTKAFFSNYKDYDFLHVHVADDPFVISSAKAVGIKQVGIHAHTIGYNETYKSQGIKGLIRDYNIKQASHYFACSNQAAKWMFKGQLDKVQIIHNGIDAHAYQFDAQRRQLYREELKLGDSLTLVHVGRFSEVKNHAFMLDLAAKLVEVEPSFTLLFVGDGPLLEDIKVKNHLTNVQFLGARLDIADILQAADVFLLPSKFEGLGMAAIESQAAGLPTLVSDRVPEEVTITDLVEFLSLENSYEIWVKKIMALKGKKERRDTYQEIIDAHYDSKQTTKDLLDYYRRVGK